ncbi:hypothetical protein BGW80DRAFT_1334781 [Lactifluus volemus]|nr:hypothetical protein BGW80DRAFT_1334781 [Lactifluus volemus]
MVRNGLTDFLHQNFRQSFITLNFWDFPSLSAQVLYETLSESFQNCRHLSFPQLHPHLVDDTLRT